VSLARHGDIPSEPLALTLAVGVHVVLCPPVMTSALPSGVTGSSTVAGNNDYTQTGRGVASRADSG